MFQIQRRESRMRLVQLLLIFTFTLSINLVLVHGQASKVTFQDETSEESSSGRG